MNWRDLGATQRYHSRGSLNHCKEQEATSNYGSITVSETTPWPASSNSTLVLPLCRSWSLQRTFYQCKTTASTTLQPPSNLDAVLLVHPFILLLQRTSYHLEYSQIWGWLNDISGSADLPIALALATANWISRTICIGTRCPCDLQNPCSAGRDLHG
jgi:hypothetical protein